MSTVVDLKSTCLKYFTKMDNSDMWKCKCGKILKKKQGTGWSNLTDHTRTQHENSTPKSNQGTLDFMHCRWLSTMQMLERYSSIKDHLTKIPGLLELLLSPVEDNEVKELSKTMVPLKSVTLALQRDEMDMASVRLLFDELLRTIPKLDAKDRYSKPKSGCK